MVEIPVSLQQKGLNLFSDLQQAIADVRKQIAKEAAPQSGTIPGQYSYFSAPNRNVPLSPLGSVANPFAAAPPATVQQSVAPDQPLEISSIPSSPFAPESTPIHLLPTLGSMNPDVYTNYPKAPDMEYFTQPQVGNLRAAEVEPLVSGEQPYQPQYPESPDLWTDPDTGELYRIGEDGALLGYKGRGFLFSDPVLKGPGWSPFSGITPQKLAGMAIGSFIPGASSLGIMGSILRNMGAHHQYKGSDMFGGGMWDVSPDSNLYVDPETGFAKWRSTSPGGGGTQGGSLNLYNMLRDIGTRDPVYQVETPRGWANARDLADIMGSGDRPPEGFFTDEPANLGQQWSGYGDLTNNQAVQSLASQYGPAWNALSADVQAAGGGYNDQRDASIAAAYDLQDQIDFDSESMDLASDFSEMDLVGEWL